MPYKAEIMSFIDEYDEKRKSNCYVNKLFRTYSKISSNLHLATGKEKQILEKHRGKLEEVLQVSLNDYECYFEGKCSNCVNVNMEWETTTVREKSILVVKTSGEMNADKISVLTKEIINHALKNGCNKLLADHRNLKLNVSHFELEFLPLIIKQVQFSVPLRTALVYNKKYEQTYVYFDKLCNQHGLNTKCFPEIDQAVDSLLEEY